MASALNSSGERTESSLGGAAMTAPLRHLLLNVRGRVASSSPDTAAAAAARAELIKIGFGQSVVKNA